MRWIYLRAMGTAEPLVMKSEFIMSLYEQLMGADKIEPQEKSIIDRSVGETSIGISEELSGTAAYAEGPL